MNFYTVNYSKFLADLCRLEMKYLFGYTGNEKYFFSDVDIDPSRSPFIKERLAVIYEGDSPDALAEQVYESGLAAEGFRVTYQQVEGSHVDYQERLRSTRVIGLAIQGEADVRKPGLTYGVTCVNGRWFFGDYRRNDYSWHAHDRKPHTYSSSLNFRVARALVNIGVGSDTDLTLIDPCCGVGTVVIEALSMGIAAKGMEINSPVALNAKLNLASFGFPEAVSEGDMHGISDHFDVAIIDIPYGLYRPITPTEQLEIIKTARRICNKLVLVTFEDMDGMISEAGFRLADKARVDKVKMMRYVNVCF